MSKDRRVHAEHWARSHNAQPCCKPSIGSQINAQLQETSNVTESETSPHIKASIKRAVVSRPSSLQASKTRPRTWIRTVAILGLLLVAVLPVMGADSSDAVAASLSVASTTGPDSKPNSLADDPELRALSADESDGDDQDSIDDDAKESSSSLSDELDSIDEPQPEEGERDDEGGIGIVGGFSGVSSFNPNNKGASLSLDKDMTSVVALSRESGMLLGSFTAEGQVTTGCSFYNSDGSILQSFFGGTLISLNSTQVGYVAGVDANGQIDDMAMGVNGPVNALFCHQDTKQVFVGGSFTSTISGLTTSIATRRSASTGGIAIYNVTSKAWRQVPFHGLDGPVYDFTGFGDAVYAVGDFSTTFDNATYVPLNTQPLNLTACNIVGGNNAEISGFTDPRSTICTNGRDAPNFTWLLRDLLDGYMTINFPFKATPSLLRLMNTMYEGRGTSTFRVMAVENNQVLAMTYLDPETKEEAFCTQGCPLQHNTDWQEFRFVDGDEMLANITGIMIKIDEYYGMGGGLNKVELYQRDPHVYAIDIYNGSPCGYSRVRPTTSLVGGWAETTAASYHGTYRTLTVDVADIKSPNVKGSVIQMSPYIPEAGFYKVFMKIPGCQNTNTCQRRSAALVTLTTNQNNTIPSIAVNQHNVLDEETEIARVYAPASTTEYSATVTIGLYSDGDFDPQTTKVEVVVDYLRFERITSFDKLGGVIRLDPDLDSDKQLASAIYDSLKDVLPEDSVVHAVTSGLSNSTEPEQVLFLGGKFGGEDQGYYNIAQYSDRRLTPLNATGLYGTVHSLTFMDTSLYVGGEFNGTADLKTALNNMAQYNTTDETWYPLNGGADGPVTSVVPYSPFGPHVVAFAGSFSTLYAAAGSEDQNLTSSGLAMWDASAAQWTSLPYIKATPTLLFADPWKSQDHNVALIAGSFSAVAALEANGTVLLTSDGGIKSLNMPDAGLQPDSEGRLVVNSGLWYAKDNTTTPVLVVGGQFQTQDGTTNLAQLQDGKWQNLVDGIDGEVLSINNAANLLFVGGVSNISIDPKNNKPSGFGGLVVYNMDKKDTVGVQNLQGPDGSDRSSVRINKIAVRADTSMVVVGGNFTTAGGLLSCPYVCTLDINESQWSPLATSTLVDQVTDMIFADKLVVAGTFKNGTGPTSYLMTYDFDINFWSNITGAENLPGPVTTLTYADHEESAGMYYVIGTSESDGTPYLAKFDGASIILADFTVGSQSKIHSMLVVPRSRIPSSVLGTQSSMSRRSEMPIPAGYVLAVSGDLYLPGGSRASSAFFYDNQWAAFLSTIQSNGESGFVNSVFFEIPPTNVYQRHRLSVALVILVAIAIALGITFLIVFVGLVYIYLRNRREAAATASAASAALAATAGGMGAAGTTKNPLTTTLLGAGTISGTAAAATSVGARSGAGGAVGAGSGTAPAGMTDYRTGIAAAAGSAMAAGTKRYTQGDQYRNVAGSRDTWGDDNAFAGEPVSYESIVPESGRLNSGSPAGLAGLAMAGRQAAVSSDTYVHYDDKKGADSKYAHIDNANESLDSIFESAAAEAEAEEKNLARERAISASSKDADLGINSDPNAMSMGMNDASAAMAAGAVGAAAAASHGRHMPTPQHYDSDANLVAFDSGSESNRYSRTSMYRPDSTNPFEQRMAMRESQGAFPPAGPFADTDDGVGHVPMPSAYLMDSEHSTAAALAGASPAIGISSGVAVGAAAGAAGKSSAKNLRRRSETTSTRHTDGDLSVSQSPSSRPSGESSVNGSTTHLPIRDSLKQYPVFYAKFTFSSRETGELGFRAGERVFVIDQSDEIWWMGIVDHGSDQPLEQGVFPATYVSSEPPKSTDWSELM
ncbi:hypothetical protein GGF40_002414 [Coemansia sp. RSA 1286]|nr:hypothetical protein GGF40_002414 [Coemansia sp. RSA 1286]